MQTPPLKILSSLLLLCSLQQHAAWFLEKACWMSLDAMQGVTAFCVARAAASSANLWMESGQLVRETCMRSKDRRHAAVQGRTHLSDAFLMDHALSMQHSVRLCEVLEMCLHLQAPGPQVHVQGSDASGNRDGWKLPGDTLRDSSARTGLSM